ncbi:MAG: MFS transporter [Gammaproteobacteria bacterium]
MFEPDTTGIRLGPFWIKPGLTRLNATTVVFGSFCTVAMIVFMGLIQPYVLNEIVHVPADRQGTVTGRLTLLQEIVTIMLVGLMGAWSDRVGRRFIYSLGFVVLGLGYLVYPLAGSEFELVVFRLLFAVGTAMVPVMLSATIQDSPQEISRGKWVGFNNIFQGLGVLLLSTALLSRGPTIFTGLGYDAVTAGRLSFWAATALCLAFALVIRAGMARGGTTTPGKFNVLAQTRDGIAAGWRNPRLALAFGAAFIGRGDLVVVGSFLTLWITQAGIDRGLSTAASVARAAMMFGIVQLAAMAAAFFVGVMSDRINRVTGLCVGLALACAGYTLMGVAADPFDGTMIAIAVLLGIGEISVIVSAGALLGQEAGVRRRGAVVGAFNLMGGIGIMTVGFGGGLIYDAFGRSAPFTVMGILNGALLLIGLFVRQRTADGAA